jgi:uncharacterized protein YeaO (DUF488 family)
MIRVKNVFERVEPADGLRVWVEPVGLARNLAEWCKVDFLLPEVAPPRALWEWFEEHPTHYGMFRQRYHDYLEDSMLGPVLDQLAYSGRECNVTLLHQGGDPVRNTAVALLEFLGARSLTFPPRS